MGVAAGMISDILATSFPESIRDEIAGRHGVFRLVTSGIFSIRFADRQRDLLHRLALVPGMAHYQLHDGAQGSHRSNTCQMGCIRFIPSVVCT